MTFPKRAFIALVKKDLVLFFSNRRALVVSIVAPIAIAAFFGYLFGGSQDKTPSRIPIAVTDLDAGPLSQKIVAAFDADSAFDAKSMGVQFILFMGIDLGVGLLLARRSACGSACARRRYRRASCSAAA